MQKNTQQDTLQQEIDHRIVENISQTKFIDKLNSSNSADYFEIVTDSQNIDEFENLIVLNECDIYNDEMDYRYSEDERDISDDENDDENSKSKCIKDNTPSSNTNFINDFLNTHSDKIINKLELNESEQLCASISHVLKKTIASWIVNCGITHSALSKFLHQIRSELPIHDLPLSSVTLLRTPKHADVISLAGGEYCHFGVKKCVEKMIEKRLNKKNYDTNINLIISTDGAPLC